MPQTEQFYSALKLLQGADGHGAVQQRVARHDVTPSNFVRTQLYLRHWFDKYKRAGGTETSSRPVR